MSKRKRICGIYKIISPTGRIYIGQSEDMEKRWANYRILASCASQTRLFRSFLKHGVGNHTFEIIEECFKEDLNCRERFWQDEFNVLNGGLNCVLQECGEKRYEISEDIRQVLSNRMVGELNPMYGKIGKHCPKSEPVINTQTLVIYESGIEAHKHSNIDKYANFLSRLRGRCPNDTHFMYVKDYEKFGVLEPMKVKEVIIPVINTLTLERFKSIAEASRSIGITPSLLSTYLSGKNANKSCFVYEKDYVEGLIVTPTDNMCFTKVYNALTDETYTSIIETSEKLNISINIIKSYLSGTVLQKTTDLRYFDKKDLGAITPTDSEKGIRVKYNLVNKAWGLNNDRINKECDAFVFCEYPSKAKPLLYKEIDKKEISFKDGQKIFCATVPINRYAHLDEFDFNGELLTVSQIQERLK